MKKEKKEWKSYLQRRQAVKQAKIRQEFLPEAQEIVEKAPSPVGHFVIWMTLIIAAFFVVWSIVGKMDEVVTARGKIVTVNGIQSVQAVNTGTIKEICVKEGEHVVEGQTIVMVDSSVNDVTLQEIEENLALLGLENMLLTEALEGKDISYMSEEEEQASRLQLIRYISAIQEEYQGQKAQLNTAMEQAKSQIELEKNTLERAKASIRYLEEQKSNVEEMISHANAEKKNAEKIELSIEQKEKEYDTYVELYDLGAVAWVEVEQLRIELNQLIKDYAIQESRISYEMYDNNLKLLEIENKLEASKNDLANQETVVLLAEKNYQQAIENIKLLDSEYKVKLTSLLVENESTISSKEAEREIQKLYEEQQIVVSPIDGVIKSLDVNTVGGVVTTAQQIASIVPDGEQMVVEIVVQNQDIGCIQVGQSVVMKMDTYNFQEYGKLEGKVIAISPDAIFDEHRGWVYQAKVEIDDKAFREKNPEIELGIGMECITEVKIGERRIIEFFLEPIVEHFDGSLKVR